MRVKHDPEANAVYVSLAPGRSVYTQGIDANRFVDFDQYGTLLGIEFLDVSAGVRVGGLPVDVMVLARALRQSGIPVLDGIETIMNLAGQGVVSLAHGVEVGKLRYDAYGALWSGGSPTFPKVGANTYSSSAAVAPDGTGRTAVILIDS
jgi:uncharacterized protein YuzE